MSASFKVAICSCGLLLLLFQFGLLCAVRYVDDTDYDDLEFYKDLPHHQMIADEPIRDEIFSVDRADDERNSKPVAVGRDVVVDLEPSEIGGPYEAGDNYPTAERIHRYTKHRIPGYDYEELSYSDSYRYHQRCDEKSVWTHCLCQFTCTAPSVVDCYTPCSPGCECREEFVYDPRTDRCVLPEQCQPEDDYLLYR